METLYDAVSPLDYRYWDRSVASYLSETAFTHYKLQVEQALVQALHERKLCAKSVVDEVAAARITAEEVYEEERRIGHDVRALVNCIQRRVNDSAKPFVHFAATSYDIVDTANAMRYKRVTTDLVVPELRRLEEALIALAEREAGTPQIGRTHGQHAVPITFGFTVAGYVSRLGQCLLNIRSLKDGLVGKFSGAVGAYNASSLFFPDPQRFEADVLSMLDLRPGELSTQIVQPEPLARLLNEMTLAAGAIANLARDMRHLQRSEIDEVAEAFGESQVGSSTMAHKRNPINWENIEGIWKIILSRMTLVHMDTVSEHQRDLTGSVTGRTYGEIIGYFVSMAKRATRIVKKLSVVRESMDRNLALTKGKILAEPLYLLLAAHGHPNAHEKARQLSMHARDTGKGLLETALDDDEFRTYHARFSDDQRSVLEDPYRYVGIAKERTLSVTRRWKEEFNLA